MEPSTYAEAVATCYEVENSELINLANFPDALAARDNASNGTDDFILLESFRLDAQHNETCFTNANGDKIDLDASAFNVDLPVEVSNPQVLVMNEGNGNVTSESDDASIGTVCQYNMSTASTPTPFISVRPLHSSLVSIAVFSLFPNQNNQIHVFFFFQ